MPSSITVHDVPDGTRNELAEPLDLELATLDARLMRAVGPRCRFHTAPFAGTTGRG